MLTFFRNINSQHYDIRIRQSISITPPKSETNGWILAVMCWVVSYRTLLEYREHAQEHVIQWAETRSGCGRTETGPVTLQTVRTERWRHFRIFLLLNLTLFQREVKRFFCETNPDSVEVRWPSTPVVPSSKGDSTGPPPLDKTNQRSTLERGVNWKRQEIKTD